MTDRAAVVKTIALAAACSSNQKGLARRLHVSPSAISMWKQRGVIPAEHAPAMQQLLSGRELVFLSIGEAVHDDEPST